MKARFWAFSKPANSTKRPANADAVEVDIEFKGVFDIIRPQLLVRDPNPTAFNYCWIEELNRYYWLDWRWINGLWEANCVVDHLASWRSGIGAMEEYVLRSSAAFDGAIQDVLYPATGDPTVVTTTIESPWGDLSYSSGHYVIGTIAGSGATRYFNMTPAQFAHFSRAAFSQHFFDSVQEGIESITKANFNPMQYLTSCIWYPWESGSGRADVVQLGYWEVEDSDGVVYGGVAPSLHEETISVPIPKNPAAAGRGKYLNTAPFTQYTLDLKPFGRIALDTAAMQDAENLNLSITVDKVTGIAILRVYAGTIPIATQSAQVGVPIQLSQVTRDIVGGLTTAVSAPLAVASQAAIGNIPGAITSAISGVGNFLNHMMPSATTSGTNGGFAGLDGTWYLVSTFASLVPEDLEHRGRPLCQKRLISSIPGFLLCADVEVTIPATASEIAMIKADMEGGFYYE